MTQQSHFAFLARSKCLLISWLQSPSALILEPEKIKSVTVSIVSPSVCHEVMGPVDAIILVFWMLSFKPTFSLSSFTFIKRLLSYCSLSAIRVVSSAYLRLLIFLLESWFQLVLHPAWHSTWCTLHIDPGFHPSVEKILWSRKWQTTPVFLPGYPMDREAR